MKEKPLFSSSVICPVGGFFILFTHILQSWFMNAAKQHNYHLPFRFHQEVGILGSCNLACLSIYFLEVFILLSNNHEPDFSNLSNCRVINEEVMHDSNLKGTQTGILIFLILI